MILFDPEGSLTILDENRLSTIFFVIVNSFTFSSEGKVYIMSSISSSIIDLNALAPVFLLYASFAIASTESGSNDNSTSVSYTHSPSPRDISGSRMPSSA